MGVCEKKTRGEGDFCEGDEGQGGWLWENRGSLDERERAKKESRGVKYFGKWFLEKKIVNRFPNFCEGFSSQLQTISVDFYFTAKQTPANDKNVLRKMFYIETNKALMQ